MKNLIYLLFASLLLSSCAHRVVRTGYAVSKSDYTECEVTVLKNQQISESEAFKVGEVKLGESGFSVSCSEVHAIKILRNEACALKADIIVITNEQRPNAWSTCYRCNATFYKSNGEVVPEVIQDAPVIDKQEIQQRVKEDQNRNAGYTIGAIVAGFLIGFFVL